MFKLGVCVIGWLGGLLVSAGSTAIILASFYLVKRFGMTVMMFLAASAITLAAFRSEQLVAWAKEDHLISGLGVRSSHQAAADLIMTMNDLGWWLLVVIVWLGFLCSFAMDQKRQQMAK